MDILCVGQLVADILVRPVDGVDFNIDTKRVDEITVKNGGDCMNTAIDLVKLGNKVSFAGKVGSDSFGNFLTGVMDDYNIDTKGLKIANDVSTSSVIVLIGLSGERCFLYHGGSNDSFKFEDINLSLVDECNIVHVGGTFALPNFDGKGTAELFRLAKSKGKITSMDVTYDTTGGWLEIIKPCLKYLDFFMPSYNEASLMTGKESPEDIADALVKEGVGTVVIKLGEKGCYIRSKEEEFYCPVFKVNVIDTTGAGDSFVAGFLTGIIRKWDLKQCAQFASAVSAHCIQQVGATTGVPDFNDIVKFIEINSK